MSDVTIITHFSEPNWPVVNKLSAICKCLDVGMLHCSTIDKLRQTLKNPPTHRNLFFTDEGLIDVLQKADGDFANKFEVALFMFSPLAKVAAKVGNLSNVKYLIGTQPTEGYGRDLSILVKKFSDGDILDLAKYLSFGCKITERRIGSSQGKKEAIEAVVSYISRLGDPGYNHPFDEYARRIATLTDELLLNAVFDANPRFGPAIDRSLPFQLKKDEEILISWGYDGEYFGISVRDPFGTFTSETVMKYLSARKKLEEVVSSQSGGLGLKFIFEKAHQIVANVRNEQVTEVIALIKLTGRIIDFERHQKSFYFFGNNKVKGAG
jgi:hypothetical protein